MKLKVLSNLLKSNFNLFFIHPIFLVFTFIRMSNIPQENIMHPVRAVTGILVWSSVALEEAMQNLRLLEEKSLDLLVS